MKFLVSLLYTTLMMAAINQSCAQDDRIGPPRFAIKWSPSHLIHFYPSIQVGVEHKLFQNITLQYDLGAVVDLGTMSNDDFINRRGFRGIGELRYYLPSPRKIPLYIAGEFYYSDIKFDRSDVIGYNCWTEDCLYYEYITYRVKHHHEGVGVKYGIILFPGWNRNRSFFFDLNLGIAYRSITYKHTGKPVDSDIKYFEDEDKHIFRPKENIGRHFRPVVGLRLGYSFFK